MKTVLAVCAALALSCVPARAQDRGQVGIAMGYPSIVSVIWHATDRIAIQPKISFSHSSGRFAVDSDLIINGVVVSTSSVTTSSDGWSVAPGVNVLCYVGRWDNVSAYLAPGYTFARGSSTSTTTLQSPFSGAQTQTRTYSTEAHEVRGVFGVQYTPHRRFAVFGEHGLRYSRSTGGLSGDGTNYSIGNTSAVGAILYF
jgi:hypothetical protein